MALMLDLAFDEVFAASRHEALSHLFVDVGLPDENLGARAHALGQARIDDADVPLRVLVLELAWVFVGSQ